MRGGSTGGTGSVLRVVASPTVVAALALLILNDRVLKARWPGLVTGKLSDVAGLLVAVAVVAVVLALLTRRWVGAHVAAALSVGAAFAAMQLSSVVAAWSGEVLTSIGVTSRLWADPWDLVALPAAAVPVLLARRLRGRASTRTGTASSPLQLAILAVASFAMLGTSCVGPPEIRQVWSDGEAVYAGSYRSFDGVHWTHGGDWPQDPAPDEDYPRVACGDDGTCYRVDGERPAVEASQGQAGPWTVVWELPHHRRGYVERQYTFECGAPDQISAVDVAVAGDSTVVVAMGVDGVVAGDGTSWRRVAVGGVGPVPLTTSGDFVGAELLLAAAVTILLAASVTSSGVWRRRRLVDDVESNFLTPVAVRTVASLLVALVIVPVSFLFGMAFRSIVALLVAAPLVWVVLSGADSSWRRADEHTGATGARWTALLGAGTTGVLIALPFMGWAAGVLATYGTAKVLAILLGSGAAIATLVFTFLLTSPDVGRPPPSPPTTSRSTPSSPSASNAETALPHEVSEEGAGRSEGIADEGMLDTSRNRALFVAPTAILLWVVFESVVGTPSRWLSTLMAIALLAGASVIRLEGGHRVGSTAMAAVGALTMISGAGFSHLLLAGLAALHPWVLWRRPPLGTVMRVVAVIVGLFMAMVSIALVLY